VVRYRPFHFDANRKILFESPVSLIPSAINRIE
jgi:hypothetical protein